MPSIRGVLAPLCLASTLAACGDDGGVLPDASNMDGSDVDASVDANPTSVRVVVRYEINEANSGEPVPDVPVHVVGGATHVTDAQGEAVFAVSPDSTIIAFREYVGLPPAILPGGPIGNGWVYIANGVSNGFDITFGGYADTSGGGTGDVVGTLTLNFPLYLGGGSGALYDYSAADSPGNCGFVSRSIPGQLAIDYYDFGCATTTRALQITATDQISGMPAAFLEVPAIPSMQTGDMTIDATGTWDTGSATTTSYVNMGNAEQGQFIIESPSYWHSVAIVTDIAGGTGTATLVDGTQIGSAISLDFVSGADGIAVVQEPYVFGTDHARDGDTLHPYVTDVTYDEVTRTFTWTETTSSVAPDLVITGFDHSDPSTGDPYQWTVYSPAGVTSVVVPDLPDAITAYDIADDEIVIGDVFLVEVSNADYAGLMTDFDLIYDPGDIAGYRPTERMVITGQARARGVRKRSFLAPGYPRRR